MKKHFLNLVVFLWLVCLGCSTSRKPVAATNVLPATALHPFGRSIVNNDQNLELIGSAVHFGFSFEGTACQIYATLPQTNAHNYLQYELDGTYGKRIRINGGSSQPLVLNATGNGKHTVWIYKATEAQTGPIFIQKITGNNVTALDLPAASLIEFIGNSITCGAAADASEVPCGTGEYHDQHNAYYAYGPRVARTLGVNYIMSSVSGIGIYRNWNSDGPTMPQVYEKTRLQDTDTQTWDFKKYAPQVVSIALGTNDFSKGDGVKTRLPFDSAVFVGNYIKFVQLVQSKYPTAQIALLSSPMLNGTTRNLLQNCLTSVKTNVDALNPNTKQVAIFFFEPMQPHGCSGHPSVEDHAILAQELEPFFKKLLQ